GAAMVREIVLDSRYCGITTRGCLRFFFFFSSRRRHTRLVSDWSSDVCSSDLQRQRQQFPAAPGRGLLRGGGNRVGGGRRVGRLGVGRASGRERGEVLVGAVVLKKKKCRGRRVKGRGEVARREASGALGLLD